MNDALFCSLPVDSSLPRDAMAALVAELTGSIVARGGVDLPSGRIAIDDDYGTLEALILDVRGECDRESPATCVLSFVGLCLVRASEKPSGA
jgi:hypothetical protein